jgi:ABC-type nitrate/sulfonate/bicarbonate transport system substrate-binding protein
MKVFKLLAAIVSFGFVATEASAQLTKITTSYVSDSAAVLPLWIAKDTGIFARNELEVQAVRVHASVGVMALLSGELQFVLASGPVVVESCSRFGTGSGRKRAARLQRSVRRLRHVDLGLCACEPS